MSTFVAYGRRLRDLVRSVTWDMVVHFASGQYPMLLVSWMPLKSTVFSAGIACRLVSGAGTCAPPIRQFLQACMTTIHNINFELRICQKCSVAATRTRFLLVLYLVPANSLSCLTTAAEERKGKLKPQCKDHVIAAYGQRRDNNYGRSTCPVR